MNIQEIEINRSELSSSDELGQHYEVEGKVKNRYKGSSGYGGFSDIFDDFFSRPSGPSKADMTRECSFNLRISAKGGEVIAYNFKDIEPSTHVVPSVSILGESPIKSAMDQLDSTSKIDAREDLKDERKRRKDII